MLELITASRDVSALPSKWPTASGGTAAAEPFGPRAVFVVHDDASVRASLELLAESSGWSSATFASAADFLACPRIAVASCLVLDVALRDLDDLDLRELTARHQVSIVLLTGLGDVPTIVRAMTSGAIEFVMRPCGDQVLLAAMARALERSKRAIADEAMAKSLREAYASLSARERDVMSLVASGLLNKQVASELGISEITVKAHRGSVMRKMRAVSFADLVRMADRLGIAAIERALSLRRPHQAAGRSLHLVAEPA